MNRNELPSFPKYFSRKTAFGIECVKVESADWQYYVRSSAHKNEEGKSLFSYCATREPLTDASWYDLLKYWNVSNEEEFVSTFQEVAAFFIRLEEKAKNREAKAA